MKFCTLTQTGMKLKKMRNGVSRVRSHRQRRTGRLLRERGTIACSQFEREHLSALTNDHARKEEPEAKTTEQAKEGESQRPTHADKRRELVLTLAPSSAAACSLVPGWVSPLPFSRYLKTTLYYLLFCRVSCQCSYVCIK